MNGEKRERPSAIRCAARSLSGKACQAAASKEGLCAIHADPQLAATLGRKSGSARRRSVALPEPIAEPKTPAEVRDVLGKVLVQLHSGILKTKTATAIAYLSSTLLKAMETADLEQRSECTPLRPA